MKHGTCKITIIGLVLAILLTVSCVTQGTETAEASPSPIALTAAPTESPTPAPTPTPIAEQVQTPTPSPTPTPEPTPTPTPEPEPFTFLWMADTQNYAFGSDAGLKALVDYALQLKDETNLIAVLHSGDIIESNGKDAEWEKLAADLSPLFGRVPFYCVAGNHDLGRGVGITNVTQPGYGQYKKYDLCDVRDDEARYNGGECWYRFFAEQELLLLGIGWPDKKDDPARTQWIDGVLEAYADYPAVILTHNFLYNDGKPSSGGKTIEKEVVARHPNVRLLLCGHHKGICRWEKTYEDGARTFTAYMYNLQADRDEGVGYCVLLTFDPITRAISFTSYSPYLDDCNYYKNPNTETFVIENGF